MKNIDAAKKTGLANRQSAGGSQAPARPQSFARSGPADKTPYLPVSQGDWNSNSLIVRQLQQFEQFRELQMQMQMQSQWQQQQHRPAQWAPQPVHMQPNAGSGYHPQARAAVGLAPMQQAGGFAQPQIRAEADVVNHVSNLLRIPMSDARLSVNFAEHPEGYSENPRRLNIVLSDAEELSLAYAALANFRGDLNLRNGERARVEAVVTGPLIPGRSGQVDLLIARQNGEQGRLVVSMANQNPTARRNWTPGLPAGEHPALPSILTPPSPSRMNSAGPRNASGQRSVRFG